MITIIRVRINLLVLLLTMLVVNNDALAEGFDSRFIGDGDLASYVDMMDVMQAFTITSKIAKLLDLISNAESAGEEDAWLRDIGDLLHSDIVVITDGREFTGRETVLEGMRYAHSRLQDDARRLESSPVLVSVTPHRKSREVTISTVQQHWWRSPGAMEFQVANRITEVTIKNAKGKWLVTRNVLRTVTGPIPAGSASN